MDIGIHIIKPGVEFLTPKYDEKWEEHASLIIEDAARTSHKSVSGKSPRDFIKKHLRHESIIEHAVFTVRFTCSRTCSHQLVRHRLASYTQESQRFCDYSTKRLGGKETKLLNVVMPPSLTRGSRVLDDHVVFLEDGKHELMYETETGACTLRSHLASKVDGAFTRSDEELVARWCEKRIDGYTEYLDQREYGIPPEDARFCLPNAVKTEVATTMNFRTWRHVLGHPEFGRTLNKHAQWEIREVTLPVLEYFENRIPYMFGDLRERANGARTF
jgi:thymidylate synthase (FAD)